MKAIQFQPAERPEALNIELPKPQPKGRDILVKVEAVGLNPVDTKVRPGMGGDPKILGYDAAGIVEDVGDSVELFQVGDAVYYAGSIMRDGTNAEYHLVDERIVGKHPQSLASSTAAALPLTAITAWESLYDRLNIDFDGADKGKSILIIGGAGGVGSMGIQLAKLSGLTVIVTASRQESSEWCKDLGADFVVNHSLSLDAQLEEIGCPQVDFIANFNNTEVYWECMGRVIKPQGKVVLIVESGKDLDLGGDFKTKSVNIVWEFMFTRSMFETEDIQRQHELLNKVSDLIDDGKLKVTANQQLSPIVAETMVKAHEMIESGRTIGKITVSSWVE